MEPAKADLCNPASTTPCLMTGLPTSAMMPGLGGPIPSGLLQQQQLVISGSRKDCIRLRGLPDETQVQHILNFLGEFAKHIVLQGVHMVFNAQVLFDVLKSKSKERVAVALQNFSFESNWIEVLHSVQQKLLLNSREDLLMSCDYQPDFLLYCSRIKTNILDSWDFDENPKYRSCNLDYLSTSFDLPDIDKMITDIVDFMNWYKQTVVVEKTKKSKMDTMLNGYTTWFVQNMSLGENVGFQHWADTEVIGGSILSSENEVKIVRVNEVTGQPCFKRTLSREVCIQHVESTNMFYAWLEVNEITWTDLNIPKSATSHMPVLAVLTGPSVLNLHKSLMKNCHLEGQSGVLRNVQVGATWNDTRHIYPTADEVHRFFDYIFDQYNGAVISLKYQLEIDKTIGERDFVRSIIKLSSWILFRFVSLHPFIDGNGRIARLLCAYSMTAILPFPVGVYNIFSPTTRNDYVDALVELENSVKSRLYSDYLANCQPGCLSTMLLESCWYACKTFSKCFAEENVSNFEDFTNRVLPRLMKYHSLEQDV